MREKREKKPLILYVMFINIYIVNLDDWGSLTLNKTIIISSPESMSSQRQQWLDNFSIPRFSCDTELQLEKENSENQVKNKMLTC